MPLVLAQNEKSAADIIYADNLGVSYEFPKRYRSLIKPGQRFVYYRGKRRADGSIQVPHYLGAGVIGAVTAHGDMYRCLIEDYQPFQSVVPFKIDEQYLEPDANGRTSKEVGLHFRTGVRTLDEQSFDAICNAGLPNHGTKVEPTKVKKVKKIPSPGNEASAQLTELAVELAVAEAKSRWPSATFFVAPPESHFKLAVRVSKGDRRHIAVKGTTAAEPLLQLTTEEIAYSQTHGKSYSIWVFYDLHLETRTGRFVDHDGPITGEDFDLAAAVHGGRLRTKKAPKEVGPVSG